MNKLFTKVATLSIGLALAVGVGVAAGTSAPKKASPVNAVSYEALTSNSTIDSTADYILRTSMQQGNNDYYFTGTYGTGSSTWGSRSTNVGDATIFRLSGTVSGFTAKEKDANKYLTAGTNKFNFNASLSNAVSMYVSTATVSNTSYPAVQYHYGDNNASTAYLKHNSSDGNGFRWYPNNSASYTTTTAPVTFYKIVGGSLEPATAWSVDDISGLYPGNTKQATVTPTAPSSSAVLPALVYESSDEDVFTVDAGGIVTAVGSGEATLTVRNAANTISDTATVTVTGFPEISNRISVGTTSKYVMYAVDGSDSDNRYALTSITSNIGAVTVESGGEISLSYRFSIVDGIYPNTVAFRISENTFIGYTWTSATGNNSLTTVTTNNDKPNKDSSWIVTDDHVILARTYDADHATKARTLKLNHNNGNPRFVCYAGEAYSNGYYAPAFYEIASQDLTGVTIEDISTYSGRTIDLKTLITPVPATASLDGATYAFSSDDESVATFDEDNNLITKASGDAEISITVTVGEVDYETTCDVTVGSFPAVSGVTIGSYYVMSGMNGDDEYELTSFSSGAGMTTIVDGSYAKTYLFKAVATEIANTVAFKNFDGKYLGVAEATSSRTRFEDEIASTSSWVVQYANNKYTITNSLAYGTDGRQLLFNSDGNKINHYNSSETMSNVILTAVTNPVTDFSINKTETTILIGNTETLTLTITPVNATDADEITWSTSNANVATVENGVVTPVAPGEATITASKTIGETLVQKTCSVIVINDVAQHEGTEDDPYTATEAFYIARGVITKNYKNEDVNKTGAYIKALVTKIQSSKLTNLSFWVGDNSSQVSDATRGFEVFKAATVYGDNLDERYDTDADVLAELAVGATVVVSGNITFYETSTSSASEFEAGGAVHYSSYIEALDFARGFNTSLESVCDDVYGNTDPDDLDTAWKAQNTAYGLLETIEKAHILEASPDEDGNDIEQMVAKYDYIVGKYNNSKTDPYNDFLGRIDAGKITLKGERISIATTISENTTVTMIIVITSIVGVTAIGGYFLFKKKER